MLFHGTINLLSYSDALENRLNVDQFDGQFEPARKRMRYTRNENAMRYFLFSTLIIAIGLNHYEVDLSNWATAGNDTEIINGLVMENKTITIGEFRKQCGHELTKTKNCFNIGIKEFTDEFNYEIEFGFENENEYPNEYEYEPAFTKCHDYCFTQKFKETCRNSELPFFCKVKLYKSFLDNFTISDVLKSSILTKIGTIISKRAATLEKWEDWSLVALAIHYEEPPYQWPALLLLILFVIFVSQLGPKGGTLLVCALTALFIYCCCMTMIDRGPDYLYLFGSKISKFVELLCTIY